MRQYLNDGWRFCQVSDADGAVYEGEEQAVRLPHTVKETTFHYFDEHEYQMIAEYRKTLGVPEIWDGKVLLLTVDGAAHSCELLVNGSKVGDHFCGYTAFTVDISSAVKYGEQNEILIRVDSRESQNIPPFGFVIDYMTYGGIYRDVYLDVKEPSYIKEVFVSTKQAERFAVTEKTAEWTEEELKAEYKRAVSHQWCKKSQILVQMEVENPGADKQVRLYLKKKAPQGQDLDQDAFDQTYPGNLLGTYSAEKEVLSLTCQTGEIELWDVENPALYELRAQLLEDDRILDENIVSFGYRKAVFQTDGFYLNGRKLKIRGLNRHQSYPYVGYAMPESMQKRDADLLKYELGLNAVRTSHYPQSHYFLDRCDEIGLLVFTEIPGWQHIGDEAWKQQAVENVKDMVKQYRNHTSIVLWGVRINESVDDDAFYKQTNEAARALDPSRPTGGVRCYKKSNLLEDVYTYNDFVHTGNNRGCDKKSDVTSNTKKAYLISEYMGHMFPTKAFDCEEHRVEHAIRHANVLNDVNSHDDIAGSFGWCMFDYNTHKDFGSGDRICYHGVMDMFRNPKMAAAVYACQQEETPILELSSSMDIGEHPGCNRGETYLFTNADSVRMYKNDDFIKEYTHGSKKHPHLINAPIQVDDYIGDLLEKRENMPHKQAEDVKSILNEVAKFGLYNMSKSAMLKAGKMMLLHHMKMDDAVSLYNKYIGDWGGASTVYRFEAIKDGKVVKTLTKAPMKQISLQVDVDHLVLEEKNSYDVAAIRIRAVDEFGNLLHYCNDPVELSVEGAIELIGPNVISLSGGMGGAYVKTVGRIGTGELKIRLVNGQSQNLHFEIV